MFQYHYSYVQLTSYLWLKDMYLMTKVLTYKKLGSSKMQIYFAKGTSVCENGTSLRVLN